LRGPKRNRLVHLLSPRVDFRFHEWEHQGHRMILLQVQPAVGSPVAFKGTEWIRVGGIKKKLKEHPGKEKELWQALSRLSFEKGIAAPGAIGDEVLAWLDDPKYFELAGLNLPANRAGILERLATERFIVPKGEDHFDITNPGPPLIDTLRFIDEPPQSRNEALAAMMRRLNICEERGTGIDKVIAEIELYQLPAPDFQATPKHTRALLYAPKKSTQMNSEARIRACYQHACLCWVGNKPMTNATVRERFGVEAKNAAVASRIIVDAVKAGLVKLINPASKSRKHAQYVPFWL